MRLVLKAARKAQVDADAPPGYTETRSIIPGVRSFTRTADASGPVTGGVGEPMTGWTLSDEAQEKMREIDAARRRGAEIGNMVVGAASPQPDAGRDAGLEEAAKLSRIVHDDHRVISDLQKQVAQSIPRKYGDIRYDGVTAAALGLRDVRINFGTYGGPYITTPGYDGKPSDWIATIHGRDGTREKMDRAYFIANAINYHDDLVRLVKCLIDNDPDDDVADATRLLDVWRKDAERLLNSLDHRALKSKPSEE